MSAAGGLIMVMVLTSVLLLAGGAEVGAGDMTDDGPGNIDQIFDASALPGVGVGEDIEGLRPMNSCTGSRLSAPRIRL